MKQRQTYKKELFTLKSKVLYGLVLQKGNFLKFSYRLSNPF